MPLLENKQLKLRKQIVEIDLAQEAAEILQRWVIQMNTTGVTYELADKWYHKVKQWEQDND